MFNKKTWYGKAIALVAMIAILAMNINVFATETEVFGKVEAEFNRLSGKIITRGEIKTGKLGRRVSCLVTENGGDGIVLSAGQGKVYEENGDMKFVVECPVDMSLTGITADILVSAEYTDETVLLEQASYIATNEEVTRALQDVYQADAESREAVIKSNYLAIDFPLGKYETLKKVVPAIEQAIEAVEVDPASGDVDSVLAQYVQQWDTVFCAAEISAATDTFIVKDRLNSELIEINTNAKYEKYFEKFSETTQEKIYEALMERELAGKKDVHDAFEDAIFTQLVTNFEEAVLGVLVTEEEMEESGKTDVDMVVEYISEFCGAFGIAAEKFDELSDVEKTKIARECMQEEFATREGFEEVLDELTAIIKEDEKSDEDDADNKPRPSVGGGGGSSSKSSGKVISGAPTVPVPVEKKELFNDMGTAEWAKEAVYVLCEKGIVNGYADGSFGPGKSITRAEFAHILIKAMELDMNIGGEKYTDVKEGAWYYKSIMIADVLGIVNGDGSGMFMPDKTVTRQDMCVMVCRALEKAGIVLGEEKKDPEFTDDIEIAEYAAEAVYALYKSGIINGMSEDTFAPKGSATRAQAAKIIYELMLLEEEA